MTVAWAAAVLGCVTGGSGGPPSLTNSGGFGCLSVGFTPFVGVQSSPYWTATPREDVTGLAYLMSLDSGTLTESVKGLPNLTWAVRGQR